MTAAALDRGLARALASLADGIFVIGPGMKPLYANVVARRLTADQPQRLLGAQPFVAVLEKLRNGELTLPAALRFDPPDVPASIGAVLYDWRSAGSMIVVLPVERDAQPAPAIESCSPPPDLMDAGLAQALEVFLDRLSRLPYSVAEAHESAPIGVEARALRRSVASFRALSASTFNSSAAVTLREVVLAAWPQVAGAARAAGVIVGFDEADVGAAIVRCDPTRASWAIAETLGSMLSRVPAAPAGALPWRIGIAAFRSGNDAVIALSALGRVAPVDTAADLSWDASMGSEKASDLGCGWPLVEAIVASHGGRVDRLGEDDSSEKILIRLPAPPTPG